MEIGAVDETRTRDLHLGKVALYQLSYYRITVDFIGADDETRTLTPGAPEPKSGASANSATPAQSDKALHRIALCGNQQIRLYSISQSLSSVFYG